MKAGKPLNGHDRDFFSLVKAATFANPFSNDRIDIDLAITGLPKDTPTPERVEKLTHIVHSRIQQLQQMGITRIDQFDGEDRKLMEIVFLFDFFHQFLGQFDDLIPRQIDSGEKPLPVDFSREALSMLHQRGFSHRDALRYFALCYQLRRAFFFIDHNIVGRSDCMIRLRRNLWNNVFTYNIGLYDDYLWNRMEDFSTLILGETGTGKGTSAVAIGRSGFIPFDEKKNVFKESFTRIFTSLNLSQFPETLIESELFGHKKGAFTGAVDDHKGIFSHCSPYGAIFLDEIGEVSFPLQIKLLQVLQERFFSPVGGHERHRFQGRVIAATNRAYADIRENRILRDDFYYRLCSDIIEVPTLSQRIREDAKELDDLVGYTVQKILGAPSPELTASILSAIHQQIGKNYPWPGNVRELEQCVRRILLKQYYEGDHRQVESDLSSEIIAEFKKGEVPAQRLIEAYCYILYERHRNFEEVARRTQLDRRTVKKYVLNWKRRSE